jgi:hypothetical protein
VSLFTQEGELQVKKNAMVTKLSQKLVEEQVRRQGGGFAAMSTCASFYTVLQDLVKSTDEKLQLCQAKLLAIESQATSFFFFFIFQGHVPHSIRVPNFLFPTPPSIKIPHPDSQMTGTETSQALMTDEEPVVDKSDKVPPPPKRVVHFGFNQCTCCHTYALFS